MNEYAPDDEENEDATTFLELSEVEPDPPTMPPPPHETPAPAYLNLSFGATPRRSPMPLGVLLASALVPRQAPPAPPSSSLLLLVPGDEEDEPIPPTGPAPPDPREDFLDAVRRLGRALGRVEVLGTWHRDRDEHGRPYATISAWAVGHLGVDPLVASLFPASCREEPDPFQRPTSEPARSTSVMLAARRSEET